MPKVNVTLRASAARPNPQDLSGITLVAGPSSRGEVDRPQTFTQSSQVRDGAGMGLAARCCAEILAVAGAPVFFVRSETTTPGAAGAAEKQPASGGVPLVVYGSGKLAGADANGNVMFQGLVDGASFTVVAGMALAAEVTGTADVKLTVPAATAASAGEAFWLGADAGATAARQKVRLTFLGTKASNMGTTLATVHLNDGAVSYTAQGSGYRVSVPGSSGQSLGAAYAAKDLTATPATDAQGVPTTTASALKAAVNGAGIGVAAATPGSGAGLAGVLPSFAPLTFGSDAAMSLSGDSCDEWPRLTVRCRRGGALGSATVDWSASGEDGTFSRETVVPPSGVLYLASEVLDTGLTATFAGTLKRGDAWACEPCTGPQSSVAARLAAVAAAAEDPVRRFGVVALPERQNAAQAAQVDSYAQAVWNGKFLEFFVGARDRDVEGGETNADFVDALSAEFAGFASAKGLVTLVPAAVPHADGYVGITFPRCDVVVGALARNGSIPVHESLGRVASGKIRNAGSAMTHDERLFPGLAGKFLVTTSYDERPGEVYFSGSRTASDGSDPGTSYESFVSLAAQVARIARDAAFLLVEDTLETIGVAESESVPRGAITENQQTAIQDVVGAAVETFLFTPKTDGRVSANPLPPVDANGAPQRTCTAPRNYDARTLRRLRLGVRFAPLTIAEAIDIDLTLLF